MGLRARRERRRRLTPGIQFNGVVLLSSVLNDGRRQPGFDFEYMGDVPSYAAIAYHYQLKAKTNPTAWRTGPQEARLFARGPRAGAGAGAGRMRAAGCGVPDVIATKLAAFTGLKSAQDAEG